MKRIITLLLVASTMIACKDTKSHSDAPSRKTVLLMDAKAQTLERLKTPSTAVFIDSLTTLTKLKGGEGDSYRLNLSVDAQNTSGAQVRNRYMIIYEFKGGDSLDIKNYELTNFYD